MISHRTPGKKRFHREENGKKTEKEGEGEIILKIGEALGRAPLRSDQQGAAIRGWRLSQPDDDKWTEFLLLGLRTVRN